MKKNIASVTMFKGRNLVTKIENDVVIVEDHDSKERWEAGRMESIKDRSEYLHKSFRLNGFTKEGYYSTHAIRKGNTQKPLSAKQERVAIAIEIGQQFIDINFNNTWHEHHEPNAQAGSLQGETIQEPGAFGVLPERD